MHKTVRAFFFIGALCSVIEYRAHPPDAALGHKQNDTEVMAARLSASTVIFTVICRTAHLGQEILLLPPEGGEALMF